MEHFLPTTLIIGLPQWGLLLVCGASVAVLVKGADWLVDGISGLAYRLGISKVIVGATVVALGTTSPETAVSVMAAWSGEPGLALGNAIGSIIADTGLIFGLGCLITQLPADRFVLNRQGWVQFGSGFLLAGLAYGAWVANGSEAQLGRWVGFLMIGLLAIYLWVSVRWSRQHGLLAAESGESRSDPSESGAWWQLGLTSLFGLGLVLLGSRALILSVTVLAEVHWQVPQVVIAATLVALGTSTPELVIGIASIVKGQKEILVGNVIGADILNVLFVVGASAVAAPLPLLDPGARRPDIVFLVHLPTMLLILLMFRVFIFQATRTGHFRRWQGIPLLAVYVLYTIIQYFVS